MIHSFIHHKLRSKSKYDVIFIGILKVDHQFLTIVHSKAFLRSLTQTHVSVNGVDSWCCRLKLRSTCSQDKDKLGWVILPKSAKLPHATSCGGYNVFDPSVRQFCFSLMMKIDRLYWIHNYPQMCLLMCPDNLLIDLEKNTLIQNIYIK